MVESAAARTIGSSTTGCATATPSTEKPRSTFANPAGGRKILDRQARRVEAMSMSAPEISSTTVVKFHISLQVADLARSVDFFRVLFHCEPAKQRRDYAKFEPDEPPLVLSLIPGPHSAGGALNHVGIRLADAAALVDVQSRLESAGWQTQREEGVE